MPDKSFFDRCASMSFGKLRDYIDSCLSALASGRPDANIPSLDNHPRTEAGQDADHVVSRLRRLS